MRTRTQSHPCCHLLTKEQLYGIHQNLAHNTHTFFSSLFLSTDILSRSHKEHPLGIVLCSNGSHLKSSDEKTHGDTWMHKQILTSCHRGGTWIPSSGRKNEVPTIFSRPLEKLNYPYIRYNEKISQKPCKIVKRTQIKGYLKNTWGLYYQVSGFFYIFHLLQITPCSADLHIPPCPPLPPPPAALESLAHSLSVHI